MLPNVDIRVLFAANSLIGDGLMRGFTGGITEISAPVSIKNERLEFLSTTKRRHFWSIEPSAVAIALLFSFPDSISA